MHIKVSSDLGQGTLWLVLQGQAVSKWFLKIKFPYIGNLKIRKSLFEYLGQKVLIVWIL